MAAIDLAPLTGGNPLAFLAALGALDAVDAASSGHAPTLRWTDELVPHAVLEGPDDFDGLVQSVLDDLWGWADSRILRWGLPEDPPDDLKLDQETLHRWADDLAAGLPAGRRDADLFCALLAEGAVAGKGTSKPTFLHFTAGQQKFLRMVRELAATVGRDDVEEALRGPWRYRSRLPILGWDARGQRIYAVSATNPADDKALGVPGADWLAFLGLTFFPVATRGTALRTTGCGADWKRGRFRWPLWSGPLGSRTIRSLLRDPAIWRDDPAWERERGITLMLESAIRRSEQGGYGSFAPSGRARPTQTARRRRPAAAR